MNAELFCFTEMAQAKRDVLERQVSTETLAQAPYTEVEIQGIAFTEAGVVTREADVTWSTSTSGVASSMPTAAGSVASASRAKSGGVKLDLEIGGCGGWLL